MGVKIGMAQIRVDGGQPEVNMARAVRAMEHAAAEGCAIVVLPECLDIGWTHPAARDLAQPIDGERVRILAAACRRCGVHAAAGWVERDGDALYNAAVLLGPDGRTLLHHRKINELSIALDLYRVGNRLGVVQTPLGRIGLNICADNFDESLEIGHVLGRMGAELILSPSAWVVADETAQDGPTYQRFWLTPYQKLAKAHDLTIVGVSNVGPVTAGPWTGRVAIGASLAVGPEGVLGVGPYGSKAEGLTCVTVEP